MTGDESELSKRWSILPNLLTGAQAAPSRRYHRRAINRPAGEKVGQQDDIKDLLGVASQTKCPHEEISRMTGEPAC